MADQASVISELYRRIDTLDPDKQAIVRELAGRMGIGGGAATSVPGMEKLGGTPPAYPKPPNSMPADRPVSGMAAKYQRKLDAMTPSERDAERARIQSMMDKNSMPGGPDSGGAMAGLMSASRGVSRVIQDPTNPDAWAGGASDVIAGGLEAASQTPGVASTIVKKPIQTALGAAGAYLGSKGGQKAAEYAKLGPGAQELAGTLGGVAGGGAGYKADHPVVKGAAKGALKEGFSTIRYGHHNLPIPATLAGAAAGRYAGGMMGPNGAVIGAIAGGAAPFVKGAIQGAKEVLHPPVPEPVPPPARPSAPPPRLQGSSLQRQLAAEKAATVERPTAPPPPIQGSSLKRQLAAEQAANPGTPPPVPQANVTPYPLPKGVSYTPPPIPNAHAAAESAPPTPPAPKPQIAPPSTPSVNVKNAPSEYSDVGAKRGLAGGEDAFAKDTNIAHYLVQKGATRDLWDAASIEQKNAMIAEVNRSTGSKYKPIGAGSRYGRGADQLSDMIGKAIDNLNNAKVGDTVYVKGQPMRVKSIQPQGFEVEPIQ